MPKVLNLALILVLIPAFTACGTSEMSLDDIEYVILTVESSRQAGYHTVVFYEPENIKKLLQMEAELAKDNSGQAAGETRNVDVKFQYCLKNGDAIKKRYKDNPATDKYWQELYNCREYQEQAVPLFKLNRDNLKKV
ncbi:MAG: hypothetical protein ACOWWO_02335 [Peptococcaceae bacterium]